MNKIFLMFLSLIVVSPALGNIHINPDIVVETVKEYVPDEYVNATLKEYNAQVKSSQGAGIAAEKLWNVCAAAGWAVEKPDGKGKCEAFVKTLLKRAIVKYFEVCGKDKGKSGGTEYCIDDFFTNKYYGGTQVSEAVARQLSKEYARIKHGDNTVQCYAKPREITVVLGATDYVIKCTSINKNAYYEFVFDDVKESIDKTIQDNIQKSVCKMYDASATVAGCTGGGTNVSGMVNCWGATCNADSAKCDKINSSLKTLGYSANYLDGKCNIDFETVRTASELKTAFGINNFVFCNGIQVRNGTTTEQYVKEYIAQKAGVSVGLVHCDAGSRTYTGSGCNANKITDFKDDIKTCYVGNEQIDLVFDDVSESWDYVVGAGESGMNCIVQNGGRFDGKFCRGLTKDECLNTANAKIPGGTEWDEKAGACVVKNAKSAQRINNGITIATGIVVTVLTLEVGGAPGEVILVAVVGSVAIDTAFIGLERLQETNPHHRALQFMSDAKDCNNANCAMAVVKTHMVRLGEILQDLNTAELDIVADEMDRISSLLNDNQFIDAMNKSELVFEDVALNSAGVVLMFAGLFAAPEQAVKQIWGRAGKFASKMTKFAEHIGLIGRDAKNLADIMNAFGKKLMVRQSYMGQKFNGYSVVIDEGDDYLGMLQQLQKNKWYYVATVEDNQRILLISKKDRLMPVPTTNWLENKGVPFAPKATSNSDNFVMIKNNMYDGLGVASVYKFERNGQTYYLKAVSDPEEIEITKRAYDIIGNNKGIVSSVRIIDDDQVRLISFAREHGVEAPQGYSWYVTEELEGKTIFNIINDGPSAFADVLRNKPITIDEQNEIISAINKLHQNGITHGDLGSNLFIIRDANGKLRANIIDYDPEMSRLRGNEDINHLKSFFEQLRNLGWADFGNWLI